MQRIEEELLKRAFSVKAEDPYDLSVELSHVAHGLGKVYEKENKVLASGPHKRSELVFSLEIELDKFSHLIVFFDMLGNYSTKVLDINITSVIMTRLEHPLGVGKDIFNSWYMSKVRPRLLEEAKYRTNEILKKVQTKIPIQVIAEKKFLGII